MFWECCLSLVSLSSESIQGFPIIAELAITIRRRLLPRLLIFIRIWVFLVLLISDPRRGCFIVLLTFIFFFFFPPLLSGLYLWNHYSQRLQIQCVAWSCGLILHSCLPSNSLCYFFIYFFFFFAKILSGPYLWNRYSLRLQIECAAWSCSLILHCCLPSNSLSFFFFFFFFFSRHDFATILSGPYLWNRYSQRLQIECAAWSCGLIVHYCLPSNSLCYLFFCFLFFPPRFCPGHISGTVTRRDSKLSVLFDLAVLLCTVAYHPVHFVSCFFCFFFSFFLPRFCPGHISGTVTHRDSKLSVLLGPAV